MFRSIKITRPPSLALVSQLAAFVVGAGLMVATGYGLGVLHTPATPAACTSALNTADRIFVTQTNLVGAISARGDALERDVYAEHDADVVALYDELEEFSPGYVEDRDECTGGAA